MRHQWKICFQFDIMYNYSSKTWIIIILFTLFVGPCEIYLWDIVVWYIACVLSGIWSMQLKRSAPPEYIENNRQNAYPEKSAYWAGPKQAMIVNPDFRRNIPFFWSLSNLLNHLKTIHVPFHIPDTKSRHNPKSCVGLISWDSVGEMGQLQRVVGGMAKFGHVIFHFHCIYIYIETPKQLQKKDREIIYH